MRQLMEAPGAAQPDRRDIVWVLKKYFDDSLDQITWVAMARELARRHEVTLVTTYRRHRLHFDGCRIVYLPTIKIPYLNHLSFLISLFVYLNWRFSRKIPDIVILDYLSCWSALGRMWLARRGWLPTRFFLDVRTVPVELTGWKHWVTVRAYHGAIRLAKRLMNGITVVVAPLREELIRRFGVDPDSVEVWGAGADPERFNPSRASNSRLREQLGLSGCFVALYHGVFSRNRGLDTAIRSVARLKDELPDLTLLLLGKGDVQDDLLQLVRQLGVEDRVLMHPPVSNDEVIDFLAMADLSLLPFPDIYGWQVSSPLKLMEAMAMEKPIVATDIRGLRDIVEDERFCFLAAPADELGLADALRRAHRHRGQLPDIGRLARRHLMERFTFRAQGERFESFLLRRAPRPTVRRMAWLLKKYFDHSMDQVTWVAMIRELTALGWEIDLVTNYRFERKPFDIPRPIRYLPSIHMQFLDSFSFMLLASIELVRQIGIRRVEAVVVEPKLALFTAPFNLLRNMGLLGSDFFMDIRTTPVDKIGWIGRIHDLHHRVTIAAAARLYQGITVITPSMQQDISPAVEGHRAQLAQWSSGVDPTMFDPQKTHPAARPFPPEMATLLYPGILTGYRGLQESVRALALLKERGLGGKMALWFIGQGEAKETLERMVKELDLSDCVRIDPPVPHQQVPGCLLAADACLLPYPDIPWWRVSSPLKLMECLAMNRPVIATRIEAHIAVLEDFPGVQYMESHRPEDQASSFAQWISRRDELARFALQGRALVEKKLTWRRQAEVFSEFLSTHGQHGMPSA